MSTASRPLVSVVTPVYNEARYLAECIESVLAQTYENWDYTIVDNCSIDGSLDIARGYAARHSRIRVHENKEFLRAIPNHNLAVRQISPESKYCKVVLADDWIFPECLERMVAVGEQHPSVGIVGAYALEGERVAWTGLPYPSGRFSGPETCRRHLLERVYVFGSANSVLYRSDLVRSRNPFYNEDNIHADTEVCFELLKSADFGFVHQVLTFSRVRPGSLTTVSKALQTDLAGMLGILMVHAPHYLTPKEYEQQLAQHMSAYYRFLAKSVLLGRETAFWDYHRTQLARFGFQLSYVRLLEGILEVLFSLAGNPKMSVEKLLTNVHGRKVRPCKQNVARLSSIGSGTCD